MQELNDLFMAYVPVNSALLSGFNEQNWIYRTLSQTVSYTVHGCHISVSDLKSWIIIIILLTCTGSYSASLWLLASYGESTINSDTCYADSSVTSLLLYHTNYSNIICMPLGFSTSTSCYRYLITSNCDDLYQLVYLYKYSMRA